MNKIGKHVITQKMIASAAGVHVSTVSLALRQDPRLPEPTRRRVQEAARRLGYEPNPLVSLLMSRVRRRSAAYRGALGYVHTAPAEVVAASGDVHRNFLAGARGRAAELGYNLEEFFLGPELNGARLVRRLRERAIAGVVIEHIPGAACPARRLSFALEGFAAASVGVPLAHPPLHYVANDQYMRAILAARELLGLGYRRLGLVIMEHFDSGMAHRCSAGFWAVQEYIAPLARLPLCILPREARDGAGLRTWLREHEPDAVLATHESVLPLTRAAGRRVPGEIGFVHLDWLPRFKPAAGVYGHSEVTGASAVELVVSQLHRGEAGPPTHAMNYLIAGSWMPGDTVRRVGPPLDLDAEFFADLLRA